MQLFLTLKKYICLYGGKIMQPMMNTHELVFLELYCRDSMGMCLCVYACEFVCVSAFLCVCKNNLKGN